jgi:hypothetical protein
MITMFMNKIMLQLLLKECRSQSSDLRDEATAGEKMPTVEMVANGMVWQTTANLDHTPQRT